ncbi:MAG: di-heme oxidoredictase family protein [Gemmatimonadaceae bacterium]
MRLLVITLLGASMLACKGDADVVSGAPGAPLPGLSASDSARFFAGKTLFNKVFTPDEGLGPAFNENQCSACHTVPAVGGTTGFERVLKVSRYGGPGACDLLTGEGGENIRTNATPRLRAHGVIAESIPSSATDTGRFLPPFLYGLGLVETIPDEVISDGADADDRDGDGISGRAARGPDGRLTRFGRKADLATIEEFTRSALRHEMGLTSRRRDRDLVNGAAVPAEVDPAPEPEVDSATIALLVDFVRFLTPPAPAAPRSAAHADTLARGRRLFNQLACASCHTPAMRTATHQIDALSHKTVNLYSDLLLHDMGPKLANVCAHDAAPEELRTTMLMGLGHRRFYLHDGRAIDLREAILAHGGEAQAARDAFARLSWIMQEYLVIFLKSL